MFAGEIMSVTPWESNAYKLFGTRSHRPGIDRQGKEVKSGRGRKKKGKINVQCHREPNRHRASSPAKKNSSTEGKRGREREKQTRRRRRRDGKNGEERRQRGTNGKQKEAGVKC